MDVSTLNPSWCLLDGAEVIVSGVWSSGSPILFDIGTLALGRHILCMEILDGLGGVLDDFVDITINDAPQVSLRPSDLSFQTGTYGNAISWTISDSVIGSTSFILA